MGREKSNQLSEGVRLWEQGGWGGLGVFDPGIHLAFMVCRRLRSPLNSVFRWREPQRVTEGQGWCSPPPSGRHMCQGKKEGGGWGGVGWSGGHAGVTKRVTALQPVLTMVKKILLSIKTSWSLK